MADEPAGDRSASVGRLYDTYGDRVYRYALMLITDRGQAADVVQDVFRAVLDGTSAIDSPVSYLRRAVRNRAISLSRSVRHRRDVALDDALLEPVHPEAVSTLDRVALERALTTLSVEQREVVHLHVFEGLTFQETAEVTKTSINTVAARYRYALAHLRRSLSPGPEEPAT